MLLQPFEKQLDLPSVLVQQGDLFRLDIHRIGEENQLSLALIVPIDDPSEFSRVLLLRHVVVHMAPGIREDT